MRRPAEGGRTLATLTAGTLLTLLPAPVPGAAGAATEQPTSAAAETAAAPLGLAELETRTLRHNPEISQALSAVRAAEGLRRQVGLWPNPRLGLLTEERSLESGRDGGKLGGFLAQPLVTGGKLRLNREIFRQEVERAEAVVELARLRELNRVGMLFHRIVAARRQLELRQQLAGLARDAVEITEQLHNTGAADMPDLLVSRIEAEQAGIHLAEARHNLDQLWQQLRAAVGDPALEPSPLEDLLEVETPDLEGQPVLEEILGQSPEVRFARAGVARAELAVRRERAEKVPDLELAVGVLEDRELLFEGGPERGSELFAELSLTLPLADRNQGNVAAAEAEVERARDELRKVRLKLEARFAPVFAQYLLQRQTVERYREAILPAAEEAHSLLRERYHQMAAAYPQVLVSRRTLLQSRVAYVEALARLRESEVLLRGMLLLDEPTPRILDDAVVRRTPVEATD